MFEHVDLRICCLLVGGCGEEGHWGRLHDDKLHNLYTARNMVTEMDVEYGVGGACRRPESKRFKHRYEDIIKTDIKKALRLLSR